jgi:hypothetical protein
MKTKWIKASEQLPPENVSVLVFIPEEDNHCTTGMWDVSKKWVLLDEYRVPKSEVTYWAEMVELPEDHVYTPQRSFSSSVDGIEEIEEEDTITYQMRELQKKVFDLENLARAADHAIEFRSTEPPIRDDGFGAWVEKFKPVMKKYRDLKAKLL